MSVSERFEDIKFTKSVAGYSTKEVDGFINDIIPLIKEQEQILVGLRAKLEAIEFKRGELQEKEHQAYALLEAAKREAKIIVASAKNEAANMLSEASVSAQAQTRAATSRAAQIISDAEGKSSAILSDAKQNSEKIIVSADTEARAMLEQVKEYCADETHKAQKLSNECAAFEASFKALVAKTATELARIREKAPLPVTADVEVKSEKVIAPAVSKAETKAEEAPLPPEPKVEPVAVMEAPVLTENENSTTDVAFAGGRPTEQIKKKTSVKRRLYDTVTVTYDDEEEFSSVKDVMKKKPTLKSPVHFSD